VASGIEVDLTDDPMTEIRALLSASEGPRIEYKRQLPDSTAESKKKVLKTVAAFANQEGGHIIFGADPNEVTLVGLGDVDVNNVRDRIGQLIRGNVVPPDPDYTVQSVAYRRQDSRRSRDPAELGPTVRSATQGQAGRVPRAPR
jgi:hypothetical protein